MDSVMLLGAYCIASRRLVSSILPRRVVYLSGRLLTRRDGFLVDNLEYCLLLENERGCIAVGKALRQTA